MKLKYQPTRENQEATVQWQREWAESVAIGIEDGRLPDAEDERRMIASIIRAAAAQLRIPEEPKRRGNPAFDQKIPDDDTIPLMVAIRMRVETKAKAIAFVAQKFDVDDSTIRKACRGRLDAMVAEVANDKVVRRGRNSR